MCEFSHTGSSTKIVIRSVARDLNCARDDTDYGVFLIVAVAFPAGVLTSTLVVLVKPPPKTNHPITSRRTTTTTAHTAPDPPLFSTTVGGVLITSAIRVSRKGFCGSHL